MNFMDESDRFSSFSIKLLNFQIGRTRSIFKINQQTKHHFLGFQGQSFIWKHLKSCWMIPHAIYGGYPYPRPVSSQFRNTKVIDVSTILHIPTNLSSLNVYGVNLSLGNI